MIPHNVKSKFSAVVTSSEPLLLGIEAYEQSPARRDVTDAFVETLKSTQVRQVFCIGRVIVPVNSGCGVPVSATVVLLNDGEVNWPQNTVAQLTVGDAFGCEQVAVGNTCPGNTAELSIDLLIPTRSEPGTTHSVWVIADKATGKPFGPLLRFEVAWEVRD